MCLRRSIFRGLTRLLLAALLFFLVGCGNIRFSGTLNSSDVLVANGTVSIVQLTAILDSNGGLVNVTIVTLLEPVGTSVLTFCGNQASFFTIGSAVHVSFTTTQVCSNLIAVVLH